MSSHKTGKRIFLLSWTAQGENSMNIFYAYNGDYPPLPLYTTQIIYPPLPVDLVARQNFSAPEHDDTRQDVNILLDFSEGASEEARATKVVSPRSLNKCNPTKIVLKKSKITRTTKYSRHVGKIHDLFFCKLCKTSGGKFESKHSHSVTRHIKRVHFSG